MTKLLEQAVEAARGLSADEQDEIARMIFNLMGSQTEPCALSDEDSAAIDVGLAELDRSAFASEEEARAVLAK